MQLDTKIVTMREGIEIVMVTLMMTPHGDDKDDRRLKVSRKEEMKLEKDQDSNDIVMTMIVMIMRVHWGIMKEEEELELEFEDVFSRSYKDMKELLRKVVTCKRHHHRAKRWCPPHQEPTLMKPRYAQVKDEIKKMLIV